jgi:hypothetical protein
MEKLDFVFQIDSEIIQDVYRNQPNYLIEYTKKPESDDKYCIIYFSSHDIYFPNNEYAFKNQLLKKNRFEWYNTRINIGEKHIFLRDIKKQWYLTGLNHKINSIEKLNEFLFNETIGYKIITIGSSAGGFGAVLFGSLLSAETIFTFNGQFFLHDLLENSTQKINPIVFKERNNQKINKYYSLRTYVKKNENIYYFYSDRSPWDCTQFKHIFDLNVKFIPFRTGRHGIPFLKTNLTTILNMSTKKIDSYANRTHFPFFFSIGIDGLMNTIKNYIFIVFNSVVKKLSRRSV